MYLYQYWIFFVQIFSFTLPWSFRFKDLGISWSRKPLTTFDFVLTLFTCPVVINFEKCFIYKNIYTRLSSRNWEILYLNLKIVQGLWLLSTEESLYIFWRSSKFYKKSWCYFYKNTLDICILIYKRLHLCIWVCLSVCLYWSFSPRD